MVQHKHKGKNVCFRNIHQKIPSLNPTSYMACYVGLKLVVILFVLAVLTTLFLTFVLISKKCRSSIFRTKLIMITSALMLLYLLSGETVVQFQSRWLLLWNWRLPLWLCALRLPYWDSKNIIKGKNYNNNDGKISLDCYKCTTYYF